MSRRGIALIVVIVAALGVGGIWLATPLCACTPALPETPDTITSLGELARKIDASQERYRLAHGRYASALAPLGLSPIAPDLVVAGIRAMPDGYTAELNRRVSPVQTCRMVSIASVATDSTRFRLDCRDGPP